MDRSIDIARTIKTDFLEDFVYNHQFISIKRHWRLSLSFLSKCAHACLTAIRHKTWSHIQLRRPASVHSADFQEEDDEIDFKRAEWTNGSFEEEEGLFLLLFLLLVDERFNSVSHENFLIALSNFSHKSDFFFLSFIFLRSTFRTVFCVRSFDSNWSWSSLASPSRRCQSTNTFKVSFFIFLFNGVSVLWFCFA